LHRGVDAALRLGRSPRGRGAWICPERACIEGIGASRFGRGSPYEGLREQVRAVLLEDASRAFEDARRAGAFLSGRHDAIEAVGGGDVLFLAYANGSGAAVRAKTAAPDVVMVVLPWAPTELGRRLGKGPRSVLVARRILASATLLQRLRRWENVG
jgi:hypothetical protein